MSPWSDKEVTGKNGQVEGHKVKIGHSSLQQSFQIGYSCSCRVFWNVDGLA